MTEILNNISNSISFSDYSDATFWVSSGRSELSGVLWFLVLSIIIILIGLAIFFVSKFFIKNSPPKKKLLIPFAWILVGLGINGMVLGLFRIEGVTFFSAYAFWGLTILSLIFSTGYYGFRYVRYLPEEEASFESYQIKKKYLPKRRKKSR